MCESQFVVRECVEFELFVVGGAVVGQCVVVFDSDIIVEFVAELEWLVVVDDVINFIELFVFDAFEFGVEWSGYSVQYSFDVVCGYSDVE